jgi:hypothetical protein
MSGVHGGQRRVGQRSQRGWRRGRTALVLALVAGAAMALPASAGAIADPHVTGKVTALSGGAAIEGIEVCVYSYATSTEECASTNVKGEYNIEVPEGSYHVVFYNENCLGECKALNYLTQYYKGKSREDEAETLVLKGSEVRSGINAAMAAGGEIEGRVTKAAGGAEVPDDEVCVFSYEAGYLERCVYTEEEGYYVVVGLPTAKYSVFFYGGYHLNLVEQYYDEKRSYEEAELVEAIAGGAQKSGISAKLRQGAEIEGVVTAAAGGAPVNDSEVCPEELNDAADAECVRTNSEGKYTLEGLEGEYGISFDGNGSTLAPELYENATSSSTEKIVKAVPPAVTKGVDGSLPTAGEITGVVTAAPSGSPVDGVEVCARSETDFSECAKTNASGEYTIKGVAGAYSVEFYGDESCTPNCSSLPYKEQYYNGVYNEESAEAVTVAPGATVTGNNARLAESVKQGEAETLARKIAEAVAKVRGEYEQKEAAQKHEQEVKAAEAAAHAAAEAAAKRKAEEKAAIASVKIVSLSSTAKTVQVTIKVAGTDTVTVSGTGVAKTVERITAGTHTIKLHLTAPGLSARKHHRKIKLAISVKVGAFVVALSRVLTL